MGDGLTVLSPREGDPRIPSEDVPFYLRASHNDAIAIDVVRPSDRILIEVTTLDGRLLYETKMDSPTLGLQEISFRPDVFREVSSGTYVVNVQCGGYSKQLTLIHLK